MAWCRRRPHGDRLIADAHHRNRHSILRTARNCRIRPQRAADLSDKKSPHAHPLRELGSAGFAQPARSAGTEQCSVKPLLHPQWGCFTLGRPGGKKKRAFARFPPYLGGRLRVGSPPPDRTGFPLPSRRNQRDRGRIGTPLHRKPCCPDAVPFISRPCAQPPPVNL